MDYNSSNATVCGAITTADKAPKGQDYGDFQKKKKKKRGPMHLIRVALYMLKLGKSTKPKNADLLKNFVGSMRPLHAQAHDSPPRLVEGPPVPVVASPVSEHLEVFTPPMSPAQASTSSSSSGLMSQYASATNLQELDQIDEASEPDNEDELLGNNEGDEMIDMKAEEFIAQFYNQMRAQNEAYAYRRNQRINEKYIVDGI